MLNQNIVHYNVHDTHKMQNDIYKKICKINKNTNLLIFEYDLTEPNDVYLLVYDNKYYRIDLISIQ
jgi:hypothetical protein